MVTYEFLEPGADPQASVSMLNDLVRMLSAEYWERRGKLIYGDKPFMLNSELFANMWMRRLLKIFEVKDDGRLVGFALGLLYRPLEYEATLLDIENYFVTEDKYLPGFFDYINNASRFMGADEIRITGVGDELGAAKLQGWKMSKRIVAYCFERE